MNVWKESFVIKIRFLTRNDDRRKVAGNWTWPETGPHTVVIVVSIIIGFVSSSLLVLQIIIKLLKLQREIKIRPEFRSLLLGKFLPIFFLSYSEVISVVGRAFETKV